MGPVHYLNGEDKVSILGNTKTNTLLIIPQITKCRPKPKVKQLNSVQYIHINIFGM